ncbi:hypothetical protein [Paenibacillus sp. Marseille-Q9583]
MKKKIVGIVAAALLLGGSIGFAASSSLIGAKVSGMYTIKQDGKKIADAIVVNNSAYVPVRTMSEATGTGLTVEGKTIILESKETEKPTATPETGTTVAEPVNTQRVLSEAEKTVLRERLASSGAVIDRYNEVIAQTKAEIAAPKESSNIAELQKFVVDIESRIAATEAIISDIKAQLDK